MLRQGMLIALFVLGFSAVSAGTATAKSPSDKRIDLVLTGSFATPGQNLVQPTPYQAPDGRLVFPPSVRYQVRVKVKGSMGGKKCKTASTVSVGNELLGQINLDHNGIRDFSVRIKCGGGTIEFAGQIGSRSRNY